MRALPAHEIVSLRERGDALSHLERSLLLFAVAEPDLSREQLAGAPLGRRDAALLELRRLTFGEVLPCSAVCPSCGERLEFSFSVGQLLAIAPRTPPETPDFQLPSTASLEAAARAPDRSAARRALIEHCAGSMLSDAEAAGMASRIAEADPLAEVILDARCMSCGHVWPLLFEIAEYFWREVSAEAIRLLDQVGELARVFGWREQDILAMSAWRRRRYLEMATA